ncbi:MAG: hypothetical protein HXY36_03655 [Chloroflexi bacterium]|nr:hypothetical protein [Chloroflexota bacterium]
MLVTRLEENPILKPKRNHFWEAQAVFNGCPVRTLEGVSLVYRALSLPYYSSLTGARLSVSSIGIAQSKDGVHFAGRRRFIFPEYSWERFGCEDPRITKFNGKYFIFYTALSAWPPRAEGIRVGLAISKDLKKVQEKHPVTPFNAKAMALFPQRIGGKIYAILTVHTDQPPARICLASFDEEEDIWSESYWQAWYKNFEEYALPLQCRPEDHLEVGAPPVKTERGWLLLYSYIRDYFSQFRERLLGVEAFLLDLEDPFKIIGRIEVPILTPEEYYERIGLVPNVVFPSGALVRRNRLYIYYGASDTTCCTASVRLPLIMGLLLKRPKLLELQRAQENPIIQPIKEHTWESKATFNPAAIYLGGKVHVIYRAMSEDNTSVFGYATSQDGVHIDYRSPEPIYVPREEFEQKLVPGGNSGCEDPRLTMIGTRLYMFYTAYNGREHPRVAVTSISVSDFLTQKWDWSKPVVITPPEVDNKDAFLFPQEVNGKYICVHRFGNGIDYDFCSSLDFKGSVWLDEHRWIERRRGWWDSEKVGAVGPPVKTKEGWIMLYHGVSEDKVYRVGAVLLDLKNPVKVLARLVYPILEPEAWYEQEGQVPKVVFPCGNVILGDTLYVYYGGGDKVVGVATVNLRELLTTLKLCRF